MSSDPVITFRPQGRFGNNVFQYLAMKVFQYYFPTFKYEYDYRNVSYSTKSLIITDFNFDAQLELVKQGKLNADMYDFICMDGFFQFSQFIEDHQDYVRGLFTVANTDIINPNFTMSHLAHYVLGYQHPFTSDDLVVHIRLDDYIMDGKNSAVIHFESYVDLLRSIRSRFTGKLYIIIDRIKYPFEQYYLHQFEEFNPILLTSTMIEDFARCYWAPNFIMSNSTFCWIPMIFGPRRSHWFPQNVGTFQNQKFDRVNDLSIIYPTKRFSF